jgi:hypothetical protein
LLVRKSISKPGKYDLVDGYNRRDMCLLLKHVKVPVRIVTGSDAELLLRAFGSNHHRIDMTPVQDAVAVRKCAALLDPENKMKNSLLMRKIAEAFSKPERWVIGRWQLLELPDAVKIKLNDTSNQTVTVGKCHVLLRLDPKCRTKGVVKRMEQFTQPAFEAYVERRVTKGKAEWANGKAAPKSVNAKGNKPVKKGMGKKKQAFGEVRTSVEITKLIRKMEGLLKSVMNGKDTGNKAFLEGKIAMGLEILNLDPSYLNLDSALNAAEKMMQAELGADSKVKEVAGDKEAVA